MGVPNNGWLIRENPIWMDDLGVPLFQETSKWTGIFKGCEPVSFLGFSSMSPCSYPDFRRFSAESCRLWQLQWTHGRNGLAYFGRGQEACVQPEKFLGCKIAQSSEECLLHLRTFAKEHQTAVPGAFEHLASSNHLRQVANWDDNSSLRPQPPLSNKENFDQWFRDVPGVNKRLNFRPHCYHTLSSWSC